jgi:hypothetical protein
MRFGWSDEMKKALALLMTLTGCANMTREGTLIRTASYLENCPEEKIRVLSISPDKRYGEAEVCGKVHRYQDQATYNGLDKDPRWLEINPLPEN